MKIIVTGGRDYSNSDKVSKILDMFYQLSDIIQGCAKGADYLAKNYAIQNNLRYKTYHADWNTHGLAAGPIRNKQMLEENQGAIVIAFNGGRGTENCIKQAKELGMIVLRVEE